MTLAQDIATSSLLIGSPLQWQAALLELHAPLHPADRWVQPDPEKPVSIKDVREGQRFAAQLPVGSGKLLAFMHADRLGLPSANALLKLLEEPPKGVSVVLFSETVQVIPTIASRLRVVHLEHYYQKEQGSVATAHSEWKQFLGRFDVQVPSERERVRELLYLSPMLHATVQTSTLIEGYAEV